MTQQTENQSEIGPTDSPRNEAGLLERPKSPDLMDRLQNVLSRIQRAQDDQVETLLECGCDFLIRDLLALLEEKDKVIEKLPVTADGVRVVPGDEVWHPQQVGECSCTVLSGEDGSCPPENDGWFVSVVIERIGGFALRSIEANIDECYSTREAALAAREQAEGGG